MLEHRHNSTAYRWALMLTVLGVSGLSVASDYQQGELVIGKVESGTKVWLDGAPVPVSDAGVYVFGLGRDAAPGSTLTTVLHNTRTETSLLVKQRLYEEQKIDGLPSKKVTPNPTSTQRIRSDNQQIKEVRKSYQKSHGSIHWLGQQWVQPVEGRISGVFGSRRILNGVPKNSHNGVDIAAAKGTDIIAPLAGQVALVHEDMFYTGKTIMLDHGLGVTSVYAHMQYIEVSVGQVVEQGQVLGQVGQSGRATGPHLHWGVTWQQTHVDPLLLVN